MKFYLEKEHFIFFCYTLSSKYRYFFLNDYFKKKLIHLKVQGKSIIVISSNNKLYGSMKLG